MSWYEWSIQIFRIIEIRRKREQDAELLVELTRGWMSLYANSNRDPQKTPAYKREDFYRLSYDTTPEKAQRTNAEVMEWAKKRFAKYLKKKNG